MFLTPLNVLSIFDPYSEGGGTSYAPTVLTLTVANDADGTGGVATIGAGDSFSTYTLSYSAWPGGAGARANWTPYATRTGNGTVPITITGYFVWQATSPTAVSNVVWQPLTGAPDSVLNMILDETTIAMSDLDLRLLNVPLVAVKKKLGRIVKEVDPDSQLTVNADPVPDKVAWHAMPNTVRMTYSVTVTAATLGYQDFVKNLALYTRWRQDVRTLVAKPGIYSRPAYDQDVSMGAMVDRNDFNASNNDVTVLSLDVLTTEAGS
jgi:hypothetical protein